MAECPNCERGFTGRVCPRCGWTAERSHSVSDRNAWKTECEWLTAGRRCLIRPSAALDGGRQFCSWHHAVALMGSPRVADHFESYEAYVIDLEDRQACAMETHYPVSITFAWVCGEPLNATPKACASETCAIRLAQEAESPLPPTGALHGRAAIAQILERITAAMTPAYPEVPP